VYRLRRWQETVLDLHFELEGLEDFEAAVTEHCDRMIGERATDRIFEDLCPMFGVIWPCARALSHRVARAELGGRTLLELGCGLALPSLVAAQRGASVVASDQHPDTERFLAANLARNDLVGRVRYASFDWRGELPDGLRERCFDRVVASDVLYSALMVPQVISAFDRFLAEDGVGWLADPGRTWLQDFADDAARAGLRVSTTVEDGGPGGTEAFVLELRRA